MSSLRDAVLESGTARPVSARTKMLASAAVGLAAGLAVGAFTSVTFGSLVGWDAAVAVYMLWVWITVWRLDPDGTERRAEHQDPTRATADVVLLSAAVVSLVAVALVLASAAHRSGTSQVVHVGLGLASVVLSWGLVHTVYTLRYASLYHASDGRAVEFPEAPDYRDFAYLSFTVGMTFQVSDTALCTRDIRRMVLGHALLSFVFATGILATTVNLVATLSSQ